MSSELEMPGSCDGSTVPSSRIARMTPGANTSLEFRVCFEGITAASVIGSPRVHATVVAILQLQFRSSERRFDGSKSRVDLGFVEVKSDRQLGEDLPFYIAHPARHVREKASDAQHLA